MRKENLRPVIRMVLENLFLFVATFIIEYVFHPKMDLFVIYVALSAVLHGAAAGILSSLAAYGACLLITGGSVDDMTVFLPYLAVGLLIGCVTTSRKKSARDIKHALDDLIIRHEKLKKVNKETETIKQEYERRLLESRMTFPLAVKKIGGMLKLVPDRVLIDVMETFSDILGTNNVAIYQGKTDSPWLRLVCELSGGGEIMGHVQDTPDL